MTQPKNITYQLTQKDLRRFWSCIPIGEPHECWNWTGSIIPSKENRAIIHLGYKPQSLWVAARILWFLTHGEDPAPLLILHTCDNPQCMNPSHHYKGTTQDNTRDRDERGRGLKGRILGPQPQRAGENHWTHTNPELIIHMERGEDRYNAKLTEQQVKEIKAARSLPKETRPSLNVLARQYAVSKKLILNIDKGVAWKHII